MIKSKLKPCCYQCGYPDIEVDSTSGYFIPNDGRALDECTNCEIYCTHYKVCKTYLETEED